MDYKYMVSYWHRNDLCGNRCGTLEEVNRFAAEHQHEWKSHSFFRYVSGQAIADLTEVDANGKPKCQHTLLADTI